MLRKLFSLLMILSLLLPLIPIAPVEAAPTASPEETIQVEKPPYTANYTYTSGTFRCEMYFSEGLVFLSGTGPRSFTDPDDTPWYNYEKYVKYVYIEEGLTSLGQNFFRNCYNLQTVEIPSTVTAIGNYAFLGCTSLTEISLPDTVTSIGDLAFRDCTGLTSITLPKALTTLGESVFAGCSHLSGITVPAENTAFTTEDRYLYNMAKTELYLAPASLSGEYRVPESLSLLHGHCLTNSDQITSVYIHENLKVSPQGLAGISNLQSITVAENNPNHQSIDGVFLNKAGTALLQYPTAKGGSYTIPHGVTYIVSDAFAEITVPFSVTFPETMDSIYSKAFYNSSGLTEVAFNDGIRFIYGQAFQNCTNLTGLTLPASLDTLHEYAFSNCTSITSVEIPTNVLRVWDYAFSGCTGLKSLSFVGTTRFIHRYAFDGCTALEKVTLPATLTEIQFNAFSNCSSLPEITIPEAVTSLGSNIFQNCSSLEKVTFPAGLTKIGYCTFENCNLKELFIPAQVQTIDNYAFYNNPSLQAVHFLGDLPATFKTNAFSKCGTGLTLRYLSGKNGWTSPTWDKYTTGEFTCTASSTATCVDSGFEVYRCDLCKAYTSIPAAPTGHSFGQWYLEQAPTVGQEGLWKRVCTVCNDSVEETVPPFAEVDQSPAVTDNNDYYKYAYDRWANPIRSYLTENNDGTLTRVEYTGSDVTVEIYDKNLTFLSRKSLPMELPIFGGFYEGSDYYFLVYGQTNNGQLNDREVIRVVRYTKDWIRHGHASLLGANTTVPFDAGSLRMVQYDNMLYIHTAHEMYASSDGLNHQANLTFCVSIPEMEITDSRYTVSYAGTGYCSHSFNQFIITDGDKLITLDHGDAYPRSLMLSQYTTPLGQEKFTGRVSYSQILPMAGNIGANDTGVSVGGLQLSDTSVLIAGNSILQDGTVAFSGQRNIFVSVTPRGEIGQDTSTLNWITSYVDGIDPKVSVSMPHLVPINGNSFLLMWREDSTLCYVFLDGQGQTVGEIYRCPYLISDCSPIVYNGEVLWYVTDRTDPAFFAIPLDAPRSPHSYNTEVSITLKATGSDLDGTVLTRNYTQTYGELPTPTHEKSAFTFLGWYTKQQSYNYQVSTTPPIGAEDTVTVLGDHFLYAHWRKEAHTCDYVTYETIPANCTSGKIELQECAHCYASRQLRYSGVAHQWDEGTITTPATCTESGVKTYTCTLCGTTKTSTISKTGHQRVTDPAVSPTCTESGLTQGAHCSRCGLVYTAQTVIPATGHSYSYTDLENGTHKEICTLCDYQSEPQAHTDNGNHVCTLCGGSIPTAPIVVPDLKIYHSLNLTSDISINYVVPEALLAEYETYYLECTLPIYKGNTLTGTRTVQLQPMLKDGYYYFTLAELHAGQMADQVEAVLVAQRGSNTYHSLPDSYSIADYAYGQLDRPGMPHTLKKLCADLLRYGSWTQTYKGYRTDSPANGAMTEEQMSYLSNLEDVTFGNHNQNLSDLPDPTLTWVGKSLILDSKVTLRFIFSGGNYSGAISDLRLKVTYTNSGGEPVTVWLEGPQVYRPEGNLYAFDFDSLSAAELRCAVSAAIYRGDTQLSPTTSYAADTYGNKATGILLTLCKALFAYSDSAKSFFAQ